jgi:V/A-type H+-transporting ATPase subunit K
MVAMIKKYKREDKMSKFVIILIGGLLPLTPAAIYFLRQRLSPSRVTRRLVLGLNVMNLVLALAVIGIGILWLASPEAALAAGPAQAATPTRDPYASIGAAIAVGIATLAAGIAVSNTGSAALAAIAERPETFGRALVFVGLAEGIGIYGLIIAVLILNR